MRLEVKLAPGIYESDPYDRLVAQEDLHVARCALERALYLAISTGHPAMLDWLRSSAAEYHHTLAQYHELHQPLVVFAQELGP
jgi:hypothetical protein